MAKEDLDKNDYKLEEEESNINFQDLERRDSNMSGEANLNFEPEDIEREGDRTTAAAGDVLITDLLERLHEYKADMVEDSQLTSKDKLDKNNETEEESQLRKKQKLFNMNFVVENYLGNYLTSFEDQHRRRPRFL